MSAFVCALGGVLAWRLRTTLGLVDIAASQQSGL
jgi:hypothetical protein